MTRDHHILDLIGIEELDGGGMGAQRHIVRFHRQIILQVSAAVERGPLLQIEMHITLQDHRTYFIYTSRHHHTSATGLRAVVDGLLECSSTQLGGIALGTIVHDVIVSRLRWNGHERKEGIQQKKQSFHRRNSLKCSSNRIILFY